MLVPCGKGNITDGVGKEPNHESPIMEPIGGMRSGVARAEDRISELNGPRQKTQAAVSLGVT